MSERYYIWMPCTIENSGFSSERRFEVDLPASGGRIVARPTSSTSATRTTKNSLKVSRPMGRW